MKKTLHVYVCSTYRDLVSERNALASALEELSLQYPEFYYTCARSIQPLDMCKSEIHRNEHVLLILGHLQGVIAPGLDIAQGEAEYREAHSEGIPVSVYLRDGRSGMHPAHFERDPIRAAQLKTFKEEVSAAHPSRTFSDLPGLVKTVTEDLAALIEAAGLETGRGAKGSRGKPRYVTQKLPMQTGGSAKPEEAALAEHQTRTIPVLQKALATPFRRRAPQGRIGKTLVVTAALIILVGLALARMHKFPIVKATLAANAASVPGESRSAEQSLLGSNAPELPSDPGLPEAESPSLAPDGMRSSSTLNGKSGAASFPTVKAHKATATVVLMDDTDPTKLFLRKALDGSPDEQFQVGAMYETGKDVPRNDSLALRWYRKAAEKGLAEAQYKVAQMYRIGKGVSRSSFQSARWFQAAAEQGLAKAQVKIGQMYQSGKGVSRNQTTAFKWFLKAADQKDPEAEKILAELKEN